MSSVSCSFFPWLKSAHSRLSNATPKADLSLL